MAVRMICGTCGSTDVLCDAYASWDEEGQTWELHSTFDNAVCEPCGGECSIDEEEIDDDICTACERPSGDCSRDRCPDVIADREA